MRSKQKVGVALLAIVLLGAAAYWWMHDAPRRQALASLSRLDAALHAGSRTELLDLLILPATVRGRSAAEQSEFLAKALNDEVSAEGLAVLRKEGAYGRLKEVFPAEAEAWATQANVNAADCVAFKLERHGLRAEVVVLKPSSPDALYRIVRVNNVKQLAEANVSTTETTEKAR